MVAESDSELMLQVKRGDTRAFTALVERYRQPVMNFVLRTLHDETEAEDLAQNVFVQVFKAAPRHRETAKVSTWIFTIARNLCLNEIRRRRRHPAEPLDASPEDRETHAPLQAADHTTPGPPEMLLRRELEQKVEAAIAALPENQRTALLLCREEDLSYEDIAAVVGCSVSATKSLIHRGRESLKAQLKPYLETGAWEGP
jgi:RNA polymerase sigma-70 factor (ECF subfamily)